MPIDAALAKQASFPPSTSSYSQDDVILYHLGIGAGAPSQVEAGELEYSDALADFQPQSAGTLGVRIRVTFSEPVTRARLTRIEPSFGLLPRLRSSHPADERRTWTAIVPAVDARRGGGWLG